MFYIQLFFYRTILSDFESNNIDFVQRKFKWSSTDYPMIDTTQKSSSNPLGATNPLNVLSCLFVYFIFIFLLFLFVVVGLLFCFCLFFCIYISKNQVCLTYMGPYGPLSAHGPYGSVWAFMGPWATFWASPRMSHYGAQDRHNYGPIMGSRMGI